MRHVCKDDSCAILIRTKYDCGIKLFEVFLKTAVSGSAMPVTNSKLLKHLRFLFTKFARLFPNEKALSIAFQFFSTYLMKIIKCLVLKKPGVVLRVTVISINFCQ